MKALVLTDKEAMEVRNYELPEVSVGEILLRVKACGICGTDVHIFHGEPGSAEVSPPIVLGHELAGEVIAIGSEVTSIKVGDRIAVDPNIYCGKCEYCRSGRVHLCDHLTAVGVTRDGGMGEVCLAPEANSYQLPEQVSFEEGALIEPLSCVLQGWNKLTIRPYQKVLIIGGGFIGQLFLQLFKDQVQQIVVSELNPAKKEQLRQLGADHVAHPSEANALRDSFDVVVECVGRKDTMELALASSRKGGQVLIFGVSSPSTQVTLNPYKVFQKELEIKGSFINPHTFLEAIELIKTKKVDVLPLVSHYFELEQVPDVLANYGQKEITKGLIRY